MAYIKIFPIKVTDKKALDYITNPDKTDEKLLVSSFGCSPETADLEFSMTREMAKKNGMDKGDNNRDCEKKSHLNRNIQFFCNFSLRTAGNSLFTAFSSGVDFFKVSFWNTHSFLFEFANKILPLYIFV